MPTNDPLNDLAMDSFKGQIGVDIAFNHGSSIGGDLLIFLVAAEVKKVIDLGAPVVTCICVVDSLGP